MSNLNKLLDEHVYTIQLINTKFTSEISLALLREALSAYVNALFRAVIATKVLQITKANNQYNYFARSTP